MNNCELERQNILQQLYDWKKSAAESEKNFSAELENLKAQLADREALYATLSTQLTDLSAYISRLEAEARSLRTETDILWGVVGGIGIAAFVYGLIKTDQVLCWSGAGLALVSAGRFVIVIAF